MVYKRHAKQRELKRQKQKNSRGEKGKYRQKQNSFSCASFTKQDSDPKQKKEVKKTAYNAQDLQPITTRPWLIMKY